MRTRGKGPNGPSLSRFRWHEAPKSIATPPGQDASPLQGYPPAVCRPYPFIHPGKERHPEVREVNHSATHASTCSFLCRSLFWRAMQGARDETLRTGAKETKLLVSTFDIS